MIDIEIRGFQSIEHVKVRIEGFTALAGRSNIGKSSIVRAVKAALSGAAGGSFVRHGPTCARWLKGAKTCRCQASVHLRTEGFDLLWEKGDSINRYVFNGVELTVPGRGYPEFLKGTGFEPVRIGEDARLIQVSDQLRPIFLLDESGATVANVLSDVARLDAINVAVKFVEKDRREANSLRKVREKDYEDLTKQLEGYDGLDPVLDRTSRVDARLSHLEAIEERKRHVEGYIESLGLAEARVEAFTGVDDVVPPNVVPLTSKGVMFAKVQAFHDRLVVLGPQYKALNGTTSVQIPVSTRVTLPADQYVNVASMLTRHTECVANVASFSGIEDIPTLPKAPDITVPSKIRQLEAWETKLRLGQVWLGVYRQTESVQVPAPAPLNEKARDAVACAEMLRRHDVLERAVGVLEGQHTTLDEEARSLGEQLADARSELRALGVCPTCAQPYHETPIGKGHEHAVVHLPD